MSKSLPLSLPNAAFVVDAAFKESLSPPTAADVADPQNPSSIDRWENRNLMRIRLLALAQPWLPLPDSTHFSMLELPLQPCQT